MAFYLKVYVATIIGFLIIDVIWLTVAAPRFYRKHLGFLLADKPNLWAAIPFYLLFIAGLVVFAVAPALQAGSPRSAILLGGFFGLVTYATYDLTNQATVKDWPWIVTLVDLCWGVFLSASVSYIGYVAGLWMT